MTIFNKGMWVAVLVSAMALILITGQTNKKNFKKVQTSISEMYEDRLVVKGLIIDLLKDLHLKEKALLTQDASFYPVKNLQANERILKNIEDFKATKLTAKEDETLRSFALGINKLIELEKKPSNPSVLQDKFAQMNALYLKLDVLSQIQLEEGKRKLSKSTMAVSSMNFFEKVENYFLVIFGILILLIIFVFPGRNSKIVLQNEAEES